MLPCRQHHKYTLLLNIIIIYISYLSSITTAISSYYEIVCAKSGSAATQQSNVSITDTSVTSVTLQSIPILIAKPDETRCFLHIFLSNDGNLTFEDATECTLSFNLQESFTSNPTISPTLVPTDNPTVEPTLVPTVDPTTSAPTTTQTPTSLAPTTTANPTSLAPTTTVEPTTAEPTTSPTTESRAIDLDEIALVNIFNVNDENIFWKNSLLSNSTFNAYIYSISPGCNTGNDTLPTNISRDNNTAILATLDNPFTTFSDEIYAVSTIPNNTALFPIEFNITSDDITANVTFTASISNDATPDIQCMFDGAFDTNGDADNISIGIDYYLFPDDQLNISSRTYLILDIIIEKVCIGLTTSSSPTNEPTLEPTFNPTVNPTEDDKSLFGIDIEIIIAISVVGGIILLASIAVIIILCRKKNIWDVTDDGTVELQGPKEFVELQQKHIPFTVTEEDHAEMLKLAAENSLSTGLEAD